MNLRTKQWVLLGLMLLSVGLGAALAPTAYLADELPPVDLQTMVPKAFGEWQELPVSMVQIVNPQQQETLEKIYSQTLSRTYVNPLGYRVMLTIAYGKNQDKSLELHSPEVCYPAQGFALTGRTPIELSILGRAVPAMRIETHLGQRYEPVTFWSTIGTSVPASTLQKRVVEFRYAITGRIPDGFLVRLSSIDNQTAGAWAIQTTFANALMQAIAPRDRPRFAGDAGAP